MQRPTWFLVHAGINPKLYDANKIQQVYAQLLSHLRSAGDVVVLSNQQGEFHDIEMTVIPNLADLWVRDFGVIETPHGVFAPIYAPSYHRQHETYLRGGVEEFRRKFWPEAQELDLVLETGNFVSNGKVAILCDKVLSDNKTTKDELQHRLEPLGLSEIILLPREPYDVIGHADGMVCLLDGGRLLCSLGHSLQATRQKSAARKSLEELERHFDIQIIPNSYTSGDTFSAVGCQVNLLNLPDKILVPIYGLPNEDSILFTIQSYSQKTVYPIPAQDLAQYGGVLHCAVFEGMTITTKEIE